MPSVAGVARLGLVAIRAIPEAAHDPGRPLQLAQCRTVRAGQWGLRRSGRIREQNAEALPDSSVVMATSVAPNLRSKFIG
jgi:hypothetical protein